MIDISPSLAIAMVIAFGAAAQWLAWRVRVPAILPLLIIGFLVGPVFGLINPSASPGTDLLFPAVGLAVGLILFEGGLTLRFPEIIEVRRTVTNLVTFGALITWLGAAAAGYFLIDLSLPLAFLFGALIIVTGPTVIGPLLQNVRPTAKVANVLKWEGILIDPIGALVAVLVFEYILLSVSEGGALGSTILLFLRVVAVGSLMGALGGLFLTFILRRRFVPDYLVNFVALAMVFTVFAVSGALAPESGLLATTLMGIIMANLRVPRMEEILSFKEDLSILAISLLFIVLAANIKLEAFLNILTVQGFVLIAIIMLVVRPLNVFISSIGQPLSFNEKLFLSWISPRGIVAASVTSLFAYKLGTEGISGAEVLEPLVYLIIVGTVVLDSVSAKPVAQWLGVAEPDPQGVLILGAHSFARRIGAFLQDEGIQVVLADTNWSHVATGRMEGLNTYYGSLLSDRSDDEVRLAGIGKLLALTSNDEANALTALKYAREFGSENVYQLEPRRSEGERGRLGNEQSGRIVFGDGVTYAELSNLFNRGFELKKTQITDTFKMEDFENMYGNDYLPMFVLRGKKVAFISEPSVNPEPGSVLVSLILESEPEPSPALN